jgi:TonB family protein
MYFDFEDYRPDITPVGGAISWREGVLLSIIAHMAFVILLLLAPRLFPFDAQAARARAEALQQHQQQQAPRFVFVQPRVDTRALKAPELGEASDQDRQSRTAQQMPKPTNPLPYSRGNTRERVEQMDKQVARGQESTPTPEPAAGQNVPPQADPNMQPLPQASSSLQLPSMRSQTPRGDAGRSAGGSLGDSLRNLQRYVQNDQFENPGGGGGANFGPLQFDTKGVEFGPWVRRFIAQVRRNWLIPQAAMSMKGHVVITFNVHKSGAITDLSIVGPCPVEAFNSAAFGALSSSNPTVPLPPEYPSEKAFFTVTFFYNEQAE